MHLDTRPDSHTRHAPVLERQGAGDGDGFREVDEADHDGQAEGGADAADEGEEEVAGEAWEAAGDGPHVADPVGARVARHVQLEDVHDGDGEDGHSDGAQRAQEEQPPAGAINDGDRRAGPSLSCSCALHRCPKEVVTS